MRFRQLQICISAIGLVASSLVATFQQTMSRTLMEWPLLVIRNHALNDRFGEGFRVPSGVRKPLMQEPAVGMLWAMGFYVLGLPGSERLEERVLARCKRSRCLQAGPQSFLRRSGVRLSDWECSPFDTAHTIPLAAAGLKKPYG
ncbi:hypothetical protein [Pelagibacterium mangrovi]|uniref:hypothetical protein n=1 Tax=Pelagibacterium mangrovi TaxID=3119828 RepID=UPI002FC9B525